MFLFQVVELSLDIFGILEMALTLMMLILLMIMVKEVHGQELLLFM